MAMIVSPNPHEVWMPVYGNGTSGTTLYVGQLVTNGIDGVKALGVAAGLSNITNHDGVPSTGGGIPLGVVTATSYKDPVYDSTYKTNSIAGVYSTFANFTKENAGVGGWAKGDKAPYVKVALCFPDSIVRMPIYNSSFGTAPTVRTVSVAGSTGLGCTVSAAVDFTPMSGNNTYYFRSGANMGIYRVSDQTSTTAPAWDTPCPAAIAVGDTLVAVNIRSHGWSRCQFDSTSQFLDCSSDVTSSCFNIFVIKLDLSVAGQEYCDFMFMPSNFIPNYDLAD